MKSFTLPECFNGTELIAELKTAKVKVNGRPEIDENGVLWLDVTDEAKTQEVLNNHIGTVTALNKTAARQAVLDKLGLTTDEVAALLS